MDSLWSNIFRRSPERGLEALLKRVPIFAALDARELAALEKILYRREYAPGEVVFRQGEPGVGMYVIEHGAVAITLEPTGRLLTTLADGDFFGEIALLNETPRSATATATRESVLWGLFQPELLDLVERSPRLGVKLLVPLAQSLGHRLIRSDTQLQALHEELLALREASPHHGDGERHGQDVVVD